MLTKNEKQALRIRPCPEVLAGLIVLANLVPQKFELPGTGEMFDWEGISRKLLGRKLRTRQPAKVIFAGMRKFFKQHFAPEKCPELYNYLGLIRADRTQEIFFRYGALSGVRTLLAAIANSKRPIHPGARMPVPYQAAESSIALVVDSDGKIQVEMGRLLEVIRGVEAERIRQCSECKSIFWAGRLDKFACDKCVGKRRVRLWRERHAGRYAESYKRQRVRKAEAARPTQ